MDVWILDSPEAVALRAADVCESLVRERPDARLGLATGRTPRALYAELARRHRETGLAFTDVVTFNLDEYVGVGPEHPRSFHRAMREGLFDHVDLRPANTHLPRGDAPDPVAEADAYESRIRQAGGIDLQVLGIGRNGHIGFNEPGSSLGSRTRVKTLSEATRRDNELGAADEAPTMAITMGIGTILDARRLLLLATGASKAAAVAAAIEGPLAARCPASAMQLHSNATVVLDAPAAAELRLTDYYARVDRARERLSRT